LTTVDDPIPDLALIARLRAVIEAKDTENALLRVVKTGPSFSRRSARKANRSFTKARVSPIQGSRGLPGGNGFPALLAADAVSIDSSRALTK
jgi:hypothetical protein